MAPAVAERRELRLALPRVERDRQLADVEARARRPDNHLRGELHPGRLQRERREHVRRTARMPQWASPTGVRKSRFRKPDRIGLPIAAERRHRARLDGLHPVPHHELCAVVELTDEARDLLEVVREVGVDHHDVIAAGLREAGEVGAPVAAPRLVHDPRTGEAREDAAAVVGAVVDDDHFAVETMLVEDPLRRGHALADALGLVQAGDDDGDAGLCPAPEHCVRSERTLIATLGLKCWPSRLHPPHGSGRSRRSISASGAGSAALRRPAKSSDKIVAASSSTRRDSLRPRARERPVPAIRPRSRTRPR